MPDFQDAVIPCWIYRSSRKDEMYLYLAKEDDFAIVPKPLFERFGNAIPVMELELHPERTLARENIATVMHNLREQGYHLQMPPDIQVRLYRGE